MFSILFGDEVVKYLKIVALNLLHSSKYVDRN